MNNSYTTAAPQPVNPTKPGVRQALDALHELIERLGNEVVSLQERTHTFRTPLKPNGETTAKDAAAPMMSDMEAYIVQLTNKLRGHYDALCATTDSVRE